MLVALVADSIVFAFRYRCVYRNLFLIKYFNKKISISRKGLSIKDVRGRIFFQCEHFADKEVLQMRKSTNFGAKNIGFFEIYRVSARTRRKGIKPVRIICRQGCGVTFSQFCAGVLYGRPQSLELYKTFFLPAIFYCLFYEFFLINLLVFANSILFQVNIDNFSCNMLLLELNCI